MTTEHFFYQRLKLTKTKYGSTSLGVSYVNNSVRFADNGFLNACESEKLSLEVFTFKEGKIIGCKKNNHNISTKQ